MSTPSPSPANPPAPNTPGAMTQPQPSQKPAKPKPLPPLASMVEAMRELVQLGSDNPRMPEGHFVDFLHALYDPKLDKFDTSLWFRTFGNWRKSVDIIDPAGNVLYVCPPVVGTLKTRLNHPDNRNQISLDTIAGQAALQGRRHPMLEGPAFKKGIEQYKPEVGYSLQSRWRVILQRYGLVPSDEPSKGGMTAESLLSDEGDAL